MLEELIEKCRSYRSFDEKVPVTDTEIKRMLENARRTPSAVNLQPLRYRICTGKEDCKKVLALTKWAGKLSIKMPPDGHAPTAFIIMCVDKTVVPSAEKAGRDIGIAAEVILLSAVEEGLGGCMIGAFDKAGVSEALSIDERYEPALVIALGKPDETIILEDAENGKTDYYRDGDNIHHVPKRKLGDIII